MYKMNCPNCQNEMTYIEDVILEAKGYISMDCEKCKGEFLVPIENPYLQKNDTK